MTKSEVSTSGVEPRRNHSGELLGKGGAVFRLVSVILCPFLSYDTATNTLSVESSSRVKTSIKQEELCSDPQKSNPMYTVQQSRNKDRFSLVAVKVVGLLCDLESVPVSPSTDCVHRSCSLV